MMLAKNIFLDVIARRIPADIVHEDDRSLAFRDIHPQAPVHILIIPKKEIRTHADMTADDKELIGHLNWVATQIAHQEGLASYRLVINCEAQAGQTVPHLHLHLLGQRAFSWPPG